jgi:hypothetical protein
MRPFHITTHFAPKMQRLLNATEIVHRVHAIDMPSETISMSGPLQ